jgi:threonine dehydrogenase-like Zn-dependent dehydrogenase
VRGLTVIPGTSDSTRLDDLPEPARPDGHLVVRTVQVGICGTDREIIDGDYGTAPEGQERLVLGHEAVGVVASPAGDFAVGDLVVPIVRRPDPVPCAACEAGEWDMCQNGRFTEHGINGADGFAREQFPLDPAFAVPVPDQLGSLAVLVEPASVVAKGWEQVERIGRRAFWRPRIALVTGAGPVGLLAALMARQRGYETYVLDRVTSGPKPDLVAAIGATYATGALRDACPPPDIVIECTGVGALVLDAMEHTGRTGIVCLAGLESGARTVELDAAALNRRLVLENDVVFGTVNANRRHYDAAVRALGDADPEWLGRLVSRAVPLDRWHEVLERHDDDVKVVLDLGGDARRP